jgi:beta-phosphoglucomutase
MDADFIFFEIPEGIVNEKNSKGIAAKMNFFINIFYKDTISMVIICKDYIMFIRTLRLKKNQELMENLKRKIDGILNEFETKAVIFDLDGTLLDNNPFHRKSWIEYLKNMGREISEEEFNENFNGRTNKDVIEYIFNRKMTPEEILKYSLEKEAVYREIYKPFIKPVTGLLQFLQFLKDKKFPIAIATSGIQPNIDFMFENVPIKEYFSAVVNSSHITKGKPDPEIYLKVASLLNVPAKNCLVFEDAVVGIDAAKAAGMKVIAVATTQPKKELAGADKIIDDFTFYENKKSD